MSKRKDRFDAEQKFLAVITDLANSYEADHIDFETAHREADRAMEQLLRDLGHGSCADLYRDLREFVGFHWA